MPLQLYPEFGLSSAWKKVDQRSLKAAIDRKTDRIDTPIDPYRLSIASPSNLIAVAAQSRSAKPTWKWAGKILQFANSGIPGHPIAYCDRTIAIPLTTARAARLTPFGVGGIEIRTQRWIRDIQYSVWAYQGEELSGDPVGDRISDALGIDPTGNYPPAWPWLQADGQDYALGGDYADDP
jgi:hypothetical protein